MAAIKIAAEQYLKLQKNPSRKLGTKSVESATHDGKRKSGHICNKGI
jgi:hypothetical protein